MRNAGLDILRFIAIALTLGRHLWYFPQSGDPRVAQLVRTARNGGWIGVDLFFVLSGFLVSGLLFREYAKHGKIDLKRFLIRRGLKLYPAFWALTAVGTIARWQQHTLTLPRLLSEVLFVQNYVGGLWPHTWSLAIEEHFYIALALLFAAFTAKKRPESFSWVVPGFAIVAGLCLTLRLISWRLYPQFSYEHHLFPTHLRADSLFYGVLISYWYHFHPQSLPFLRWPTWLLVLLAVCLSLPAFVFPIDQFWFVSTVYVIALYLAGGFALTAALRFTTVKSRLARLFATVGGASYSIYLWHESANSLARSTVRWVLHESNWYLEQIVYLLAACTLGYCAARLVEMPVLGLRDRLFPSPMKSLTNPTKQLTIGPEYVPTSDSRTKPNTDQI